MVLNEKSSLQKLFVKQFQALRPDIKQHQKKSESSDISLKIELCMKCPLWVDFGEAFQFKRFSPTFFSFFLSIDRARWWYVFVGDGSLALKSSESTQPKSCTICTGFVGANQWGETSKQLCFLQSHFYCAVNDFEWLKISHSTYCWFNYWFFPHVGGSLTKQL